MNTSYDCAEGRITDNGLLLSGRFDGQRAVLQRRPSSDLTFLNQSSCNDGSSILSDSNTTFRRSLKTQERRSSKDVIDIIADQDFTTSKHVSSLLSMNGGGIGMDTMKKVISSNSTSIDSPGLLLQKKSRCSYSYSLQKIASLRPLDLDDHTDQQHDSSMNSSSGGDGFLTSDKRNVRFEVEPTTGAIVTHEIAIDDVDDVYPVLDIGNTVTDSCTIFDLDMHEEKVDIVPKFVATSASSVSTTSTSSSKRRGRRRTSQNKSTDSTCSSSDNGGMLDAAKLASESLSDPKMEAKKLQQFYDRRENRRAWRIAKKEAGSFLLEDQTHVRLANELHTHWDVCCESKSSYDTEQSSMTKYIESFYTQWAASDGRGLEHPVYISSSSASLVSAISDNEGDHDDLKAERLLSAPSTPSTVTVSMSTSDFSSNDDNAEGLLTEAIAATATNGQRARPKLITPGMAHKLAAADAIVARSYYISD